MAKESSKARAKKEAGVLTVDDLRDLHRKLGYLGHSVPDHGMKIDFFAAQRDIEDLVEWDG
jgi:hypothetical protein